MIPAVGAWLPYLSTRVGHAPFEAQDEYGEHSYGTTTWYPAHIEEAMVRAVGGGNEVISGKLHIIIGAAVPMDPRDKLLVRQPFTARQTVAFSTEAFSTEAVSGITFSTEEQAQQVRVSPSMGPVFGHHHTEVWTE